MDSEAIANGWGPKAFCPADEHYIPTLLASRGLDNETDCTVSEQACASGRFWKEVSLTHCHAWPCRHPLSEWPSRCMPRCTLANLQ